MSGTDTDGCDPWARLARLCDHGTLTAVGPYVRASAPADQRGGVVAAVGRVGGRPVACYANDRAHLAGSIGAREAETLERLLELAWRERLPVVGFVASAGARIHEGRSALDGFARIFRRQVRLRGRVPQITVVCGASAGGGCYAPALSDFVVMTASAAMFLTGPAIVGEALGERVTAERLGGPRVHERNGVCNLVAADDDAANSLVQALLSFFPATAIAAPITSEGDDPGAALPPRGRQIYDVRDVIRGVVDGGSFLELDRRWAPNMLTGLARLVGRPVGVVANQPRHLGGVVDASASQKAARFVSLCDTHGLPLVVLVDTPGFMPGSRQEEAGIIRHGAGLLRAFAAASVPRVTVVLRKAYGGAYITMNSKDLGADAVLAWHGAETGIMDAHRAVELIHRRRLASAADRTSERDRLASAYAREHLHVEDCVAGASIDAVIAPRETRERVAEAVERASVGERSPLRNGGEARIPVRT